MKKLTPMEEVDNLIAAARMAERARVVKIVEGMKNYRRPTHGECCTCQKCGGDIDDCDCKRNAIISDILSALEAPNETV